MAFYDEGDRCFVISFLPGPKDDFGVFGRGYSNAASTLAEYLLSRSGIPDYDAYPVVFLYRHSFELYLKHVIYQATRLVALRNLGEIDDRLQNSHDLSRLAAGASEVIRRLFPEDPDLESIAARLVRIASEYAEIDPSSYSYRYPIDLKGLPSTRAHQVVSLEALYRTMSELLDEMDTLDFGLQIETSKAEEFREWLNGLWP